MDVNPAYDRSRTKITYNGNLLKLPAMKAGTREAEMNSMTNKIKHFLRKVLCLALLASWSFSFAEDAADSRIAGKNDVYKTAEQIFATSWMPKDTEISVLDEGTGLWNIQAMDGNNNILAICRLMATLKT